MPIADSARFQLLDVGKHVIYAVDYVSSIFERMPGRKTTRAFAIADIGGPVEFLSRGRSVTGWLVSAEGPPVASVLLFHGIGDRTHYWRRVQHRLAQAGIGSLIFDLPGYGGNCGATTPENMEADAIAAYALLRGNSPSQIPIVLFGFSLGSGLAAQIATSLIPPPSAIVLSEAFTTLREAARRATRPASILGNLIPDLWRTRENVAHLGIPLLLIHSSGDKLFPYTMAEDLLAAAHHGGTAAELQVLPGYAHDAPYRLVPEEYWRVVIEYITRIVAAPRT